MKYIDVPEKDYAKCVVKKGDVLFNRTNSIELVGKTCVYELDYDMIIAGYIIRVRTKQDILKPEDSVIYYFSKASDSMETKVEQLLLDINGKINESWPKGFFDEYDNQLDQLITW